MANDNSSRGFSLLPMLFLVFLVLKLTNYINWSWWWVTAPLWAELAIVGIIGTIAIVVIYLKNLLKK